MKPGNRNSFRHLHEAYRAFKKKNYTKALIILERAGNTGYEDYYGLFLQALCQLYSNNFSAANSVMEKIQRINPLYTPFIQLKSFLAHKSSTSREEALQAYISALEKTPADRLLRRGMKSVEEAADFRKYQKEAKISGMVYIPKPVDKDRKSGLISLRDRIGFRHGRRTGLKALLVALTAVVLAASVTVIFFKRDWKFFFHDKNAVKLDRGSINKIEMVDIGGSAYGLINRISQEKSPEFYASGDALTQDFTEARMLVKQGYFNRALLILNRIANSNASFPVKEKCDFLVRFIMDSHERVYEEIDLQKLNEKPWLYRGSAVRFTGKALNVKESKNGASFSVMTGYDGESFRGIYEVFNPQSGTVSSGDMVEVMGIYIYNIGGRSAPYVSAEKVKVIGSLKG
jgi:tetratricopeptide (TPR) repeat protein